MKTKFALGLFLILTFYLFYGCTKQETVLNGNKNSSNYFSEEEIFRIKNWLLSHRDLSNLRVKDFPKPSFNILISPKDSAIVKRYENGIMYTTDDIFNKKQLDYKKVIELLSRDKGIDQKSKAYLLSFIQLSKEVFTSPEIIQLLKSTRKGGKADLRDVCGCDNIYNSYLIYATLCLVYGIQYGHCSLAVDYYNQYMDCMELVPHCPYGFEFDGANCYSGVHFPSGYNGFVLGNGFYTQQNCSISTSNNCCPNGFTFDGSNCHYWGVYFPSDYEAFILNNTFYVKPKCE